MPFSCSPHPLNAQPWKNRRVGLMGGSFNPPHAGHVHLALTAMKTLRLGAVWWLVTPQSPLKDSADTLPYDLRLSLCRDLVKRHPRIFVSDIERQIGTLYTVDTVRALIRLFPRTEFVWVSGMDSAYEFHRWKNWRAILAMIPTLHVARPPAGRLAERMPLSLLKNQHHIHIKTAGSPALRPGTTFWVKEKKMLPFSSTRIRETARNGEAH